MVSPLLRVLVGAFALSAALACGGATVDTIDREVFISTYVDLRVAALETDTAAITPADREEILQRHGVSAEDLTTFADVHGADLDFMRDVWNEVELRLDQGPEEEANGS